MADLKISQLTSATTPLAGTEVLPIVQSSSTKKVATDDLTVKNVRSNATTGILQIAGPGASSTRVMTTPDANFTAARTDAAQSFTGDQTLGTGNLIQGTAAKGINFTANTPAAGMTSRLLNAYEEGTWTPADGSGAALTFTVNYALYTRVGRQVSYVAYISYPVTADATAASIQGFPYSAGNAIFGVVNYSTAATNVLSYFSGNTTKLFLLIPGNNTTNAEMSGKDLLFSGTYFI